MAVETERFLILDFREERPGDGIRRWAAPKYGGRAWRVRSSSRRLHGAIRVEPVGGFSWPAHSLERRDEFLPCCTGISLNRTRRLGLCGKVIRSSLAAFLVVLSAGL